jgi:hypothetical protein
LATGNRFQDSGDTGGVSILLGNGDGTFQSHVEYDKSVGAYSMTMGDFNRDGKLDLIFFPGGGLVFLEGNGDGTFQSPQAFSADANAVEALITADLNGDGKLDLIAADYNGGAYVLLGNGDGTFQSPVEYAPGHIGVDVVAADFNADGNLDLVLTSQNDGTFYVLLGNGDGTFQTPTDFPTNSSWFVAAGDFNGDGKMDFVLCFQPIGTTSPRQSVTLTNTGSLALTISNISISGANASDFAQSDNCPPTLGVNANCLISVTFTPSAAGTRTAAVRITDNGTGSPQTITLTGNTPPAPAVTISPASVTFPNQYVGTSGLPETVTVTNAGTATLTITNVTTSIADFGTLSNCTNSVAPNKNCTIGVFFDPTASGTRTGALSITDNVGGGTQTVTLSGMGQDFSLAPSGQTTATVTSGQTASYTVAVTPGGGFNPTVAMSCSGAPAQSTCSLSSSSVGLNGSTAAVVNVTIKTAGGSAAFTQPFGRPPYGGRLSWFAFSGTLALAMLLGSANWLRQRRPLILYGLAFLCLLSIGVTMSACGGGSGGGGSGSSGGTEAGTYNLTVTGTFTSGSTTLTRTAKLTLVVR